MNFFKKHGTIAATIIGLLVLYANEILDPLGYQLTKIEAEQVTSGTADVIGFLETMTADEPVTAFAEITRDVPSDCVRRFFVFGDYVLNNDFPVEFDQSKPFPEAEGKVAVKLPELSFHEEIKTVVDPDVDLRGQLQMIVKSRVEGWSVSFTRFHWIEDIKGGGCPPEEEPQQPTKGTK